MGEQITVTLSREHAKALAMLAASWRGSESIGGIREALYALAEELSPLASEQFAEWERLGSPAFGKLR